MGILGIPELRGPPSELERGCLQETGLGDAEGLERGARGPEWPGVLNWLSLSFFICKMGPTISGPMSYMALL